MDSFPRLKSGATLQYGGEYKQRYRTDVLTYVDGSEQRVPNSARVALTWRVRLQKLNANEATAILDFFYQQRGRAGTFLFTDPWTTTDHVCCFDVDSAAAIHADEADIRTDLTIREVFA